MICRCPMICRLHRLANSRSPSAPTTRSRSCAIPPHSIEAEQSVLGGLLLDNSAWDRAGDLLTDSDFYRYEHRLIYAAIGGAGQRAPSRPT